MRLRGAVLDNQTSPVTLSRFLLLKAAPAFVS